MQDKSKMNGQVLFHEIYGSYYLAAARLVQAAQRGELSSGTAGPIIGEAAFSESFLYILESIQREQWQIITKEFATPLQNPPVRPLTELERRWLAAVRLDPRIRLFLNVQDGGGAEPEENREESLPAGTGGRGGAEIEAAAPLYRPEDFLITDRPEGGDPYEDGKYRAVFQTVLLALQQKKRLRVYYVSGKGRESAAVYRPYRLEYSEKEDRFRLLAGGGRRRVIINLARIRSCEIAEEGGTPAKGEGRAELSRGWENDSGGQRKLVLRGAERKKAVLELLDERNALERCMLHFADLQKVTAQIAQKQYKIELFYRKEDETELLIRVLSFGPFIKAVSPPELVELVVERLRKQKKMPADGAAR